jgi:5-formyltetrahydrofolate cyclo-ligase
MVAVLKFKLRQKILRRLKRQSNKTRRKKSRLIQKRLFRQAAFQKAKVVLFYFAKQEEVQTDLIIKDALKLGKKIAVPVVKVDERKMVACLLKNPLNVCLGPYGIREPLGKSELALKKIDLVVAPGLAFDRKGKRLGRGKGYYDKFLKNLPKKIPVFGLAYACQIVKSLPSAIHDQPVSKVITA